MNSIHQSVDFINGSTTLVGLVGSDIRLSRSLPIHNSAFQALDLNWAYLPLPVEPQTTRNLESAVYGLKALGFAGANITMPFKESIIPFLDEVTPAAQRIGAVNTILIKPDKRIVGGNSDSGGFLADLRENNIQWNNRQVLLLGAGGAARAVAYGLAETGCPELCIFNRTHQRAHKLAEDILNHFPQQSVKVISKIKASHIATNSLIINCTPVGMKGIYAPSGNDLLWPNEIPFLKTQVIVDLVYAPLETPLLKKAKAMGAVTINGLGMLVQQAALSFSWWTSYEAPIHTMYQSAKGAHK